MLNEAVDFCLKYPGATVGIFRRTYPELHDTHITKFIATVDPKLYKYNAQNKEAKFAVKDKASGTTKYSTLKFCHCQHEKDVMTYNSVEFDRIYFDELTTFTEYIYKFLISRVRSILGYPTAVKSGTNPIGVGKGWVKRRWRIGQIEPYTTFEVQEGEATMTRCFIPALLQDNPALNAADPGYIERLKSLGDAERKALLYGDWTGNEGTFFTDFRKDDHVIEPFSIPEHWVRMIGYDYGYAAPAAGIWGAADNDGRIYIYREFYGTKMTPSVQNEKMVRMNQGEDIESMQADPSIFSKKESESCIADDFKESFTVNPANNDRRSGWAKVQHLLKKDEPCPICLKAGKPRCPRVHIFNTCPNLIRELEDAVYDKNKQEDLDTTGSDHALDALRYLVVALSSKGIGAVKNNETLEEFNRWRSRRING